MGTNLEEYNLGQERGELTLSMAESGNKDFEENKAILSTNPSFSGWCEEGQLERQIILPEEDEDGCSPSETVNSELAQLRNGSLKSNFFRQRSSHFGENEKEGSFSFDVENGLHPCESRTKLELFEQSVQSSISVVLVLKTLFYIVLWYIFSTCLTLYNKELLGDKLGKFPAPLLMNTFHFVLQAVLSNAIIYFRKGGLDTTTKMSSKDYFVRVVPMALGTAIDINLSNASLVFISVTFATMCKSASPIFLVLFAFAFRLESPSIKLLGVIFIISVGVLLTVVRETEFELWGFLFVILASVMSGFRWSLAQIFLQNEAYGLKDPITLMSYVTPIMTVVTALLSLLMDPWKEFHKNSYFDSSWHIVRSCLLMLIGGSLAFLMVLTEYILISATSAVTATIAGVVKEAITILVAVIYFHDQFTWLKGVGLLTIMIGVSLFNWYKYQKLNENHMLAEGELEMSNGAETKYTIVNEIDCEDDES